MGDTTEARGLVQETVTHRSGVRSRQEGGTRAVSLFEGGSESSVIGGVTLLIDMIDYFIIP